MARPVYFSWQFPKVAGEQFNIFASEWNMLTDNINAVRSYRGISDFGFTTVSQGDVFINFTYNQAVEAMFSLGISLPMKLKGDPITAECLNDLVTAINSIT